MGVLVAAYRQAMARRLHCIGLLDVDAFYASVELLRRPELSGKPVIVSGSGPRAVVTTASYEARRFGVGSAMPTARARRLCPDAILIPPDFPAYREMSERVMALVRDAVPTVEQVGLDEAYLDLSGLVAPKAAMRRLQNDIHATTGLGVSIGIGPNKLVAKVCSDLEKPRGSWCHEHRSGLRALRAGAAQPGPRHRAEDRRAAARAGDHHPAGAARRRRRRPARALRAAPRPRTLSPAPASIGSTTLSEHARRVSRSNERTFDTDIADRDEMERVLQRLAERPVRDPAPQGGARAHDRDQGPPRRLHHRHPRPHH